MSCSSGCSLQNAQSQATISSVRILSRSDLILAHSSTVWLNGGPGCSSLQGLTSENGPLSFAGNATHPMKNPYSWTKFGYMLFIDQPVGTGYSTGPNQTTDNAEAAEDFCNWLKAFYARFPGLKSKNTYIMGESYAGVYVSKVSFLEVFVFYCTNGSRFPTSQLGSLRTKISTSH